MTVTMHKGAFASALGWVARVVPNRPATPVLAGIRISSTDSVMTCSAFDYEQSAAVTLDSEGDDVDVVIPGRLVAELAKSMSGDRVLLDVAATRATLKSGRSTFTLPLFPLRDYPALPTVPPKIGVVAGKDFAAAVSRVAVAAGNDDSLPALTGVYVHVDPERDTITLAATDRYRLGYATIPYTPHGQQQAITFLVPAKALTGYAKMLSDEALVDIRTDGSGSLFGVTGASRTGTTRLLDGKFPEFAKLMPTEFTCDVTLPVAETNAAAGRVSIVADKQPIRLTLTDGEVRFSVGASSEADAAAVESLSVAYHGDEESIAFNPAYLHDGLKAMESESFRLQLVAPNRPALLVPDVAGDSFKYLLMPVRVA